MTLNGKMLAAFIFKRQTILETRWGISYVMLQYFKCKQNALTNNIWTYTSTTVKITAKDVNHIQTELLYICLFTDFFFFFLWWHQAPPSVKMPWGYLSVKVVWYKVKIVIWNIYKSRIFYVLSINLLGCLSMV